jgi:uncharacterized repeat protein (TIGR03803 family)
MSREEIKEISVTTPGIAFFRTAIGATLLALFLTFSLQAMGQSEWVVHSFTGLSRGYQPVGILVADTAGNLYGVAQNGPSKSVEGFGIVYELVRPISPNIAWTETVLYTFTNPQDGDWLRAGLVIDKAGNLYGTTYYGGLYGAGNVFELSPPTTPGGAWTESTLHSFQPANGDGGSPMTELVLDGSGNLYGVTTWGGHVQGTCFSGCGTIFQLSPPATAGGAWTETVLYAFNDQPAAFPQGSPIFDANGNLYGTTYGDLEKGGNAQWGAVYRLSKPKTAGGTWIFKTLYVFRGYVRSESSDGGNPTGALTLRGKGILYGTTTAGGLYNSGTVFQLVPPAVAGDPWAENILYNFTWAGGDIADGCGSQTVTTSDGCAPTGHLLFDSAGNIFGTTTAGGDQGGWGTFFELTPPATSGADWTENVLHRFGANAGDGSIPRGGLIFGQNGVLFGVTQSGGKDGVHGTVFGVVK